MWIYCYANMWWKCTKSSTSYWSNRPLFLSIYCCNTPHGMLREFEKSLWIWLVIFKLLECSPNIPKFSIENLRGIVCCEMRFHNFFMVRCEQRQTITAFFSVYIHWCVLIIINTSNGFQNASITINHTEPMSCTYMSSKTFNLIVCIDKQTLDRLFIMWHLLQHVIFFSLPDNHGGLCCILEIARGAETENTAVRLPHTIRGDSDGSSTTEQIRFTVRKMEKC